jgi:hypothetical protein
VIEAKEVSMNRGRVSAVLLGLALAAPAAAEEGTWVIAGSARYVARYEGRKTSGTVPFAVTATLEGDGTYEATAPFCATGPTVLTGRWTPRSTRALRSIVRDGVRASLTSCGGDAVRVRDVRVRERVATGGDSIAGSFDATVRYRERGQSETETIRARVHAEYSGTRTDP